MAPKNYRRFLGDLQEELQSCIADAENLGWHHAIELPIGQNYVRLITWEKEINDRIKWYDDRKAKARLQKAWRELSTPA